MFLLVEKLRPYVSPKGEEGGCQPPQTRFAWSGPDFDEATRRELTDLANTPAELEDRFYRNLEFGTGGLRGIIAAGTNRMNRYVVRQATQGLSNYRNATIHGTKWVVIAHDCRRFSRDLPSKRPLR